MKEIILSVAVITGLTMMTIGLITLVITYLSRRSAFFMKIYMYVFSHREYELYQEAKGILESGNTIPVLSGYTDTSNKRGMYFLALGREASLWKDTSPALTNYYNFVLDELIEKGNLRETIRKTQESDNRYQIELDERIARLEKEIMKLEQEYNEVNK